MARLMRRAGLVDAGRPSGGRVNESVVVTHDLPAGAYSWPSQLLNLEMLRGPLECKQYTSIALGLRCKEAGVRPSMGPVADCYHNAMCEIFFATLECELLDRRRFRTQAEARMAVFDFIEGCRLPEEAGLRDSLELPIGGGVTTPELKEWLGADFQTLDAAEGVACRVERAGGE